MATTIHIDIDSAEAHIFSGEAEMVVATGALGELGIAPNHSPLITTIKPGQIRVIKSSTPPEEEIFYVSGGLLEVQPSVVTVLADTVVRAGDLDEAKAIEAKNQAEHNLRDRQADFDYAKAASELAQAVAQLQAIQKLKKRAQKS